MANSVFARKQLLKHGWTEGSGLGKDESGIKEAIKVKIKNDTTGVGHDPGKEFTCHWWDHVFNKAANSLTVETTEAGVLFKKSSEKVKEKARTLTNKSVLYSGFVKGAVLQATDKEVMTEVSCHDDNSDSESDEEKEKKAISKLTEEELFSQCEGRTAHKGARHGLKQNAKLLRIQHQEQLLLEQFRANQKKDNFSSNWDDRHKAKDNHHQGVQRLDEKEIPLAACSDDCPHEMPRKKKKSKRKPRDVDITTDTDVVVVLKLDDLTEAKTEEAEGEGFVNRKRKKSKKKKRKSDIEDENGSAVKSKKSKKNRS
ncbi:G patch domain-containing protein 4-like [Liolophura sinensis]|uniref:G patch domain-containing protein 4-like n=1 Tax=Liolophura sinensis TaxID=3198878 RepID=UPI0031589D58